MTNYEEAILHSVSSGRKGVELVMDVINQIGPGRFDKEIYQFTLENLIKEEKIMEIEYTLPHLNYVKSFYLPAGTKLEMR